MLSNIYIIVHDARKFFHENIINILMLSIFSALISVAIQKFFSINITELLILYNNHYYKSLPLKKIIMDMQLDQKKIVFYMKYINIICIIFSHAFLCTSIKYLIKSFPLSFLKKSSYIIMKTLKYFFLLMPIIWLKLTLIEIGSNFFIIFNLIVHILFSLSPIICLIEKKNILDSLHNSLIISWKYIYVITPAVLFGLMVKSLMIVIFKTIFIFPTYINFFISDVILNIGFIYVTIYLFRLYHFFKIKNIIQ
ncbi:YciC family protein [Buchnera aphidicola]|uniref:UPF0259 membrane protein YciC n=1 Tax=Buchnera aphidicola (Cinara strobi) TaxID=1921549 RepID=A0A3B1DLC8_9GAMM|nr:YciC family protein [Buchnera aphidicola]VAX76511.1 UPF0259 membrane protein YciC [Buchnera aphidicola (Cinara strobi)]